jgi:aryl-alcohol dehydrogenase-like predicted oxidoreductase
MFSKSMDLSRLALGTVQFGLDYGISNTNGKTNAEEVKEILRSASEAGIDTLDTAAGYGDCEKIIGNCNSQQFKIVSKFSGTVHSAEELSQSLEQSLVNLKRASLYGYLAHDADTLLKQPDLWQSLLDMKHKGSIKKIGYSLYLPEQLEQLLAIDCIPGIVQVPYNFIDRRFEKYFEQLKSLGCEIHARSAFLQGLFFLEPAVLSSFFKPVQSLLVELKQQFKSNNELAGFLMSFVLKNNSIDKLVFGINTTAQLLENINNLQLNTASVMINWHADIPEEILMPNKWPV